MFGNLFKTKKQKKNHPWNVKGDPNIKCEVDVIETLVEPRIIINTFAYAKMKYIVQECTQEVGWLGTCRKQEQDYYIDDIYLFKQTVSSVSTTIVTEGLAGLATDMVVEKGDEGVQIVNNLRFWGHSHVNMAVNPSGQDDRQMLDFAENVSTSDNSYIIRGIFNKKGDIRFDIYDYKTGLKYVNVNWEVSFELSKNYKKKLSNEISDKVQQTAVGYAGNTYKYQYTDTVTTQPTQPAQVTKAKSLASHATANYAEESYAKSSIKKDNSVIKKSSETKKTPKKSSKVKPSESVVIEENVENYIEEDK